MWSLKLQPGIIWIAENKPKYFVVLNKEVRILLY